MGIEKAAQGDSSWRRQSQMTRTGAQDQVWTGIKDEPGGGNCCIHGPIKPFSQDSHSCVVPPILTLGSARQCALANETSANVIN